MRHNASERGASAVEYGLLMAGIAAMVVVIVFSLGRVTSEKMGDDCSAIGGAIENALQTSQGNSCHN